MERVCIWTDGGGQNPGPGGHAAVLFFQGKVRIVGGYSPDTTNNQSETMGVVLGLRMLKVPSHVEIVTDSQYVRFGMERILEGRSLLEKNREFWELVEREAKRHKSIKVTQVRGHSKLPFNELADIYAGHCAEKQCTVDERYETVEDLFGKRDLDGKA